MNSERYIVRKIHNLSFQRTTPITNLQIPTGKFKGIKVTCVRTILLLLLATFTMSEPRVLEHATQSCLGEIQAPVTTLMGLKGNKDSKRLCITFEVCHPSQFLQLVLAHVSERRMTEVMCQTRGLGDIRVKPTERFDRSEVGFVAVRQVFSDAAGDLRHL
jgi:hypothetical protein